MQCCVWACFLLVSFQKFFATLTILANKGDEYQLILLSEFFVDFYTPTPRPNNPSYPAVHQPRIQNGLNLENDQLILLAITSP